MADLVGQATFSEFFNSFVAWVSLCVMALIGFYLRRRFPDRLLARLWCYLKSQLFISRPDGRQGGELAGAGIALLIGIFIRASGVLWWRWNGAVPGTFPLLWDFIGIAFKVAGMLCVVRILWVRDRCNWPWLAIGTTGLIFAAMMAWVIPTP